MHGHTNVNTWSNVRFHDQHVNWLMTKCCAFQISWQYRRQTATNDQTCISWSHKCQHTNPTMWLIKCLDYQQTHKKCASHDHLSQLAFHMITQISLVHKCRFMTSYYFQQTSHGQPHKFWHTFSIKIVTEADVTIVIKIVIRESKAIFQNLTLLKMKCFSKKKNQSILMTAQDCPDKNVNFSAE